MQRDLWMKLVVSIIAIGPATCPQVQAGSPSDDEWAYQRAMRTGTWALQEEIRREKKAMREAEDAGRTSDARRSSDRVAALSSEYRGIVEGKIPPRLGKLILPEPSRQSSGQLPDRRHDGRSVVLLVEKVISSSEVIIRPQWTSAAPAKRGLPRDANPIRFESGKPLFLTNIDTSRCREGTHFWTEACFYVEQPRLMPDGERLPHLRRIGPVKPVPTLPKYKIE